MPSYLDEQFWYDSLGKPNWFTLLHHDFERLEKLAAEETDYATRKQIKRRAYELVEQAVAEGRLPMATSGDNFDGQRKPIDTIVIHHTKNKPGMTLERLNAIHLLRIYGPNFADPANLKERHLRGQLVWSGHFYKSKQVFWGYHWLVREDGTTEQILDDSCIGWQAGNWDINTRSIGICIDDDLSDKAPSDTVIQAVARIIGDHYSGVKTDNVVGHCDANPRTKCPGHLFHESWRQKLILGCLDQT